MIMEQAKKYFNKPSEVEIGEDKFKLTPLTVSELPDFIYITSKLKDIDETSKMVDFFGKFNKEDIKIITDLILVSLKRSYPNEGTDEEWNEFIVSNFNILSGGLLSTNSLGMERSHEMLKKLEHLKRLKDEKDAANKPTENQAAA